MKIVWLCHYSLVYLKDKIAINLADYHEHPSTWMYYLGKEFKSFKDTELHIISYSGFIKKDLIVEEGNTTYHIISYTPQRSLNELKNNLLKFTRLIKKKKIDKKIRNVVTSINPDIINIHGTENDFALVVKNLGYPVLIWIAGLMNIVFRDMSSKYAGRLKKNEIKIFKSFRNFVTKKGNMETEIRKYNPNPVFYNLYYPISSECFNLYKEKIDIDSELIFVGTLLKRKGIEDFIEVCKIVKEKYPNIRAKIIGAVDTTEYLENLKNKIHESGLDSNIRLIGELPAHQTVLTEMKKSMILVLPTYADTAPVVVAESMGMGVTVVSYQVDGLPEMITNEDNGILVKKGSLTELAEAIIDLINHPEKRKKFADNAFLKARDQFYAPDIAGKTMGIYKEIIIK